MQPLQAKLRWDIDVRPLHRETSTIRFVPTSERRRAIVTCSATMCATIGVTGYPRSASCPRRRAVALPHSRRRRAAAGSVPPPLLDRRKSVAPTTCANLRATSIGVTGYPRSASCPRRRAIALRWTTLVRWSGSPYPVLTLPPHVGRRCTYTMPHKAVEKPKVSKLPAPIAL